jgi:hypothetical protein
MAETFSGKEKRIIEFIAIVYDGHGFVRLKNDATNEMSIFIADAWRQDVLTISFRDADTGCDPSNRASQMRHIGHHLLSKQRYGPDSLDEERTRKSQKAQQIDVLLKHYRTNKCNTCLYFRFTFFWALGFNLRQ